MANLAQIAGLYSFLLFGVKAPSTLAVTAVGVVWIAIMTGVCVIGVEVNARTQRWLLDLVRRLAEAFPDHETFKAARLALERDIVDAVPYPLGLPLTQELEEVILALYFDEDRLLALAARHQVKRAELKISNTYLGRVRDILEIACRKGTLRALVGDAVAENAGAPEALFLQGLLAEVAVPVAAKPPVRDGGSRFIVGDDQVSREALLFFDDLTMYIAQVPGMLQSVASVLARAPAVCLLTVETALASSPYYGTGFRIAPGHVLTNHHVLVPDGQRALRVTASFEYDGDPGGAQVTRHGDPASIVGEAADDWAVIAVADMAAAWPILGLATAGTPVENGLAYIIQHPGAHGKRLGFVRNKIGHVDAGVVKYVTDTQPGSSGAPVFDASGALIALHHAGGEKQRFVGKPPVSMNEGIRISRIVERMRAYPALASVLEPHLEPK